MSTLKVNKLRDTAGSADAITLDPNGGAVLAGVTTVTSVKVGAAVTISESGIEASGIGITCANINGTQIGGRRNKVINGAMQVAQRGTSDAMGNSENAYGTVDRFKITNVHDGAITASQSSTSPDGFSKSLKIDVTTADTDITTSQRLHIVHYIEAQDLQDLGYGTSSAKEVRVSFYVRSNKTGNYTFALNQADNSYKNISIQYTINSADTWERKSFVIPGDTAGVINDDNGAGIELYWWLVAGPTYTSGSLRSDWTAYSNADFAAGQGVNLLDSTSNEFYLTGVQFEVGPQATPFEHRSFGEELKLCYRYYQKIDGTTANTVFGVGNVDGSTQGQILVTLGTPLRTKASSMDTTGSSGDYKFRVRTTQNCDAVPTLATAGITQQFLEWHANSHGFTDGDAALGISGSSSSYLAFSAEL